MSPLGFREVARKRLLASRSIDTGLRRAESVSTDLVAGIAILTVPVWL